MEVGELMKELLQFLSDLIVRFTARSFVLTAVVIYLVATRPDMSVEQIVGLLSALGFLTVRSVAEDRVAVGPPIGTEISPNTPDGEK